MSFAVGEDQRYGSWKNYLKANDSWNHNRFYLKENQAENNGGAVTVGEEPRVEPSEEGSNADNSKILPCVQRVGVVIADGPEVLHAVIEIFFDGKKSNYVKNGESSHSYAVVFGAIWKFNQFTLSQKSCDCENGENAKNSDDLR